MNEWMKACVHFLENFCSSLREVASSIGFLGLTMRNSLCTHVQFGTVRRGERFVRGEQFPVAFSFPAQIRAIGEAQT